MTFEEIEKLIGELLWYAKEAQSDMDSPYVPPKACNDSFDRELLSLSKLKEAIKQYGKQENTVREGFDEVSGVKLSLPTEHVE